MPPQEWTPVALLAQLHVYYRQHNGWPTLQDLTLFTQLPADRVRVLLDILVDRRLVRVEGETIYPWEAGPSPVVTYRLSPEEIAARYGPPKRYKNRTAALQAAAAELVGCWPERHERTSKEGEIMPKGTPIQWPPDEELLAMANEIRSRGGDVVGELSARFGCSPLTLKKQLGLARRAVLRAAPKEVGGDAAATSEGEPDPGEAPSSGELMQMAEEEANRIVEATVAAPEPRSVDPGTSDYPLTETALSEAHTTPAPDDLRTMRTMLLVDPDRFVMARERDHVTRAPEKPGDHWAQPVRRQGFLRWREWVCVAVLADGTCLMVPPASARGAEENVERRTA